MTTYTTPNYAFRAPNDDEPVRKGAEAVRNLAVDVDTALTNLVAFLGTAAKTAKGSLVATPNGYGWLSVTFPAGLFASAPVVTVSNGDMTTFAGGVDLLQPATATGFVAAFYAITPNAQAFTRAYALWAASKIQLSGQSDVSGSTANASGHNHGAGALKAGGGGFTASVPSGATGAPAPGQTPTGAVRLNWIAVGN